MVGLKAQGAWISDLVRGSAGTGNRVPWAFVMETAYQRRGEVHEWCHPVDESVDVEAVAAQPGLRRVLDLAVLDVRPTRARGEGLGPSALSPGLCKNYLTLCKKNTTEEVRMSTVWMAIAVVGAIVFIAAIARFFRNLRLQAEMGVQPMTPLEKLGWVGLAVTGAVGAGLAILVAIAGMSFFDDNSLARGIFWLLIAGGMGAWFAAWRLIKHRSGETSVDERDRAILARSFSVESLVVLLSLLTWTVSLTEVFSKDGVMPLAYLQLIFWSTFIGGAFGRSLGIVLGYRREIPIDA